MEYLTQFLMIYMFFFPSYFQFLPSCKSSCGKKSFFYLLRKKKILFCRRKFYICSHLQLQTLNEMKIHKLQFDYSKCSSFVKNLHRLNFIHLIYNIEDISKAGGLDQVLETGFQELEDYGLLCYKTGSYQHCVTVLPGNEIYDAQKEMCLFKNKLNQEGITCVQMFKLRELVLLEWLQNCAIDNCDLNCSAACVTSEV